MDEDRWQQLPRPVGFVFAGGATLGALQVGMLRAIAETDLTPDLVVGTSVGSLNGAVLADTGDVGEAARILDAVWRRLTTGSVFPGNRIRQGWRVVRGHSVYPDDGLRALVDDVLGGAPGFERLALPLAVVATSVLTGHPDVFTAGDLLGPLLASSAIPGLLPIQRLDDGHPYWDGGVAANVPLLAAVRMGARSLVVLDPGDICHREVPPDGAAASTLAALGTAIRQRVLVEVEAVAAEVPLLYLDRPCVTGRHPLSFRSTPDLLERGAVTAREFLAQAPLPEAGQLVGAPHDHPGEASDRGGHEPRFPQGMPEDAQDL